MSFKAPRFEAHISVTSSTQFGVAIDGGATAYIPVGDYFLGSAFTSGSSFLAALATVLSATVAATTCTVSTTTGQITITWGSGTHTIAFNTAAFAMLLGFQHTSYTAAAAFTSEQSASCIWLPLKPMASTNDIYGGLGDVSDDTRVERAQSGVTWKTTYNQYRDKRFDFGGLVARKVWGASETVVAESLESFWRSFLSGDDGVFRWYTDSTDATSFTNGGVARDYTFSKWESPKRFSGRIDTLWSLGFDGKFYAH